MRKISEIIIHCSDSTFGDATQIRSWHLNHPTIKFRDGAYHYIILNGIRYLNDKYDEELDGTIESLRRIEWDGGGVHNYHDGTLEVCLIGPTNGKFSVDQYASLKDLITYLLSRYPTIKSIVGHKERENTLCPMFDVRSWLNGVELNTYNPSGSGSK